MAHGKAVYGTRRREEAARREGRCRRRRDPRGRTRDRHRPRLPRLRSGGLVVEITDGDAYFCRGHFFYDLVKTTVIRMAFALSQELKERDIPAVAVTPGFLRSEWMLDHFGVTEANWRDAATKVKEFIATETPLFVGRCVAALADPNVAKKILGEDAVLIRAARGQSEAKRSVPHTKPTFMLRLSQSLMTSNPWLEARAR